MKYKIVATDSEIGFETERECNGIQEAVRQIQEYEIAGYDEIVMRRIDEGEN